MGKKIKNKLIHLDKNENYFFIRKKILANISNLNVNDVSYYPDYDQFLKSLATYTKRPEEEIYPTNGSDFAIEIILKNLVSRKDSVLVITPIFITHVKVLQEIGARIIPVDYKDNGTEFVFPFNEIRNKLKRKPKLIIFCNPNNPTGSTINKEQIIHILNQAKHIGAKVLIDEAYYEFLGETSADLLDKFNNLIITRSFSKSFGLAGVRLGYVLSSKINIKKIRENQRAWNINSFALHTGIAVLKQVNYFSNEIIKMFKLKNKLVKNITNSKIKIYQTKTNFILLKTMNSKKVSKIFEQNKILVSNLDNYLGDPNHLLKNFIRISIPSKTDLASVYRIIKSIS